MDKEETYGPDGESQHATGEDTVFPPSPASIGRREGQKPGLGWRGVVLHCLRSGGEELCVFLMDSRSHIYPWIVLSLLFSNSAWWNCLLSSFCFTWFQPYSLKMSSSTSSTCMPTVSSTFLPYLIHEFFYDLLLWPGGRDSFSVLLTVRVPSTHRQDVLRWASCHSDAPSPLCPALWLWPAHHHRPSVTTIILGGLWECTHAYRPWPRKDNFSAHLNLRVP